MKRKFMRGTDMWVVSIGKGRMFTCTKGSLNILKYG